MISRYTNSYMEQIWSEENRFNAFLKVELAVAKAWGKLGIIPQDDLDNLINNAKFELKTIKEIELETKHDVIAFTRAVSQFLGAEKKWFHYGLTSTDVVDTALSVILKEVNQILAKDIQNLLAVLKKLALKYRTTATIGRTHGVHAEITSFGLKFALYYDDINRNYQRFKEASKQLAQAKISGAVGNYANIPPIIQEEVAKELGLVSANISTQVLSRDNHAYYLATIALLATSLEKIATEIRHLQRTEVAEVKEYFSPNQKGSSAMPHKQNPIASENICGIARVIRGYMQTSFENIALWHERDISHSSAERIILPDATTLLDYIVTRYTNVLDNLIVDQKQMLNNINLTYETIFSQQVLNQLINANLSRETSYDLIQPIAFKAYQEKTSFKALLLNNKTILNYLTVDQINNAFDLNYYFKEIDYIYNKVFNT